jgi:hypothetical protein
MKKTVQIVTIPLDKEGWNEGDIILCVDAVMSGAYNIGAMKIAIYDYPASNPYWQAQQLLVLSDDEIQDGDYFLNDMNNLSIACKDTFVGDWYDVTSKTCKKIIASYPQLEGTTPISKETVKAWIDSGTPVNGMVTKDYGFEDWYEEMALTNHPNWRPMVDPNGNLILIFLVKSKTQLAHVGAGKVEFMGHKMPTIPTEEEIEAKAEIYADKCDCEINRWEQAYESYKAAYRQALKDLGIIK